MKNGVIGGVVIGVVSTNTVVKKGVDGGIAVVVEVEVVGVVVIAVVVDGLVVVLAVTASTQSMPLWSGDVYPGKQVHVYTVDISSGPVH